MHYEGLLTEGAERDLEEIHSYITDADSPIHAEHVLTRLLEVAESLATTPERGSYPKESLALGPGGHLKFLHLWPGQTPPPLAAGRGDFSLVNGAWQPESVVV